MSDPRGASAPGTGADGPSVEERVAAAERRAAMRRARRAGKPGSDPVSFAAAIQRLLATRGWQHEVRVAGIESRWPELVGADIAAHCQPVGLVDGELTVAAESTAWATQLRLLAPQLLARLNTELGTGTVRRIRVHGPTGAGRAGGGGWRVSGGRGPRDTYG